MADPSRPASSHIAKQPAPMGRARRRGLLTLLQLADSAFPVGSFAYSDGLESLGALGLLDGPHRLEALLRAHRRLTLSAADGWFVRTAHAAADERDADVLRKVAEEEVASHPAEVQRRASLAVGHALLRAALEATAGPERELIDWIRETLGEVTPRATSFGAVAQALGAGPDETAEARAYSALAGMVSAAVRLRIVGALEGQAVLRRVLTSSPIAPEEDWASFSPLLDIAAMSHERLEPRLFAS